MNSITVRPGSVAGTVRAPGSKSITHRSYVLAARSDAPVTVAQPLRAADPDATLACLHALGARVAPGTEAVHFDPADWHAPAQALDCRNAGTALRLLTAQAAVHPFPVAFTGDASLRQRPNAPLLESLRNLGARIDAPRDGACPYSVQGPLQAGHAHVEGTSSQFASALLMALPLLRGASQLRVEGLRSAPYLDVTQRVLQDFAIRVEREVEAGVEAVHADAGADLQADLGAEVESEVDAAAATKGPPGSAAASARTFVVPGGQVPRRSVFEVPGDWSAAAFPLAAAAVSGGKVQVQGLRWDEQGDRAILDILASFGARIGRGSTVSVEAASLESPGTIDVAATPDLFPVLCAVAACARGTTSFTGGESLRHKECDRIAAMAQGLAAMDIDVSERPDGLVVHGGAPRGAFVSSHGDHRIHMAFAVLARAATGETLIDDPACVAISYPGFHSDLAALEAV